MRAHPLETRVPPPVVALTIGALMWAAAQLGPVLPVSETLRIALGVLAALAGLGFNAAGLVSFRRARTTFNPLKPETASALVRSGVYRVTRNPMYVGMTLLLLGWALYLAAPWAVLGPPAFMLYITRFQIGPEERALATMFGADFERYKAEVRRWL